MCVCVCVCVCLIFYSVTHQSLFRDKRPSFDTNSQISRK